MAPIPAKLTSSIDATIETLFQKVYDRFFGPFAGKKRIIIGYRRDTSLAGIYESALINERGIPSKETLDALIRTASNYLEGEKAKAKARVINAAQAYFGNVTKPDIDAAELQQMMGEQIVDIFGDIKTNVARIVDSETQHAKNLGSLEGIIKATQSLGIVDPTIFFVVVRDGALCEECKRLHLMSDEITPRLWRMSEVESGYHKHGDDVPSIAGEHPSCRCVLTTLVPGYGFNKAGRVEWVEDGWDELTAQRGL